jgi:DNA-binding CsgD family transcriptional regulator
LDLGKIDSPLVGRGRELERLEYFLAAMAEMPVGCLLEGEAGIGKTVLWEQTVHSAMDKHHLVMPFRAVEAEATFGYCCLSDLLGPVLGHIGDLPPAYRRAIDVSLLRVDGGSERIEPRAVAMAVLHVLRTLAGSRPVLIAIDDIQWLDDASARALAFAVRRLEREPVGVLITHRHVDPAGAFDLPRLMPDERLIRERLRPLSTAEMVEVVRMKSRTALPRGVLSRIVRQAGGNPFYALELTRHMERAVVRLDELPAESPDLHSLVGERIAVLPTSTRRALLIASALSVPKVTLIAMALGRVDGRVPALVRAEEASVIAIEADIVRFTHPLLASAVYAGTPLRERRRCHRALARVVDDPEEQAEHEARGADRPAEEIAHRLDRAARRADARGAPETAADLSARAAALTPPALVDSVLGRQIATAKFLAAAGDTSRARLLMEDAIPASPPGPVRAAALNCIADIVSLGAGFLDARPLLEQALAEVGDDLALRARVLFSLGNTFLRENQRLRGSEVVRDLIALTDRLDDNALRAQSLSAFARVEFMLGRGVNRDLLERAVAAVSWDDDPRAALGVRLNLGVTALEIGEHEAAREQLDTVYAWLVARCDETRLALVLVLKAHLEFYDGNWRDGLGLCEMAVDAAVRAEQEPTRVRAVNLKCRILAHLGRIDEAEALAETVSATSSGTAMAGEITARVRRGFIALSRCDFSGAQIELQGLRQELTAREVFEPAYYYFLPDLIEALIRSGNLAEAREPLEWYEERGSTLDRSSVIGCAARCRALLEQAEGHVEAGLASADRAVEAHERRHVPFELARTLLVKGTLERNARHKEPARKSLQQALNLFDELGARLWADWTRAELAHIGGRPSSPGRLTPTERRVADLVATGRSNEEVARLLFMTAKTVEWNLTKVYRKLYVRSRTELAAKLSTRLARTE